MSRYDDIINLPHHVSPTRQRMSMHDRAAQFAPFAALTGYEAAVGETARLTAERRELDAQEAEEGNLAVRMLPSRGGCGIFPFRRRRWSWRTGRSSVLRILPRFLDFSLKYE